MGTRIYVGRLPYDVRERDVEKFFKGYGRVREILMKDGFAFVVRSGELCVCKRERADISDETFLLPSFGA